MKYGKNAIIISGFPGIGKSYYCCEMALNDHFVVLDSDSSKFSKDKFPWNYIDHIESNLDKADVILVSSHQDVRNALKEAGIHFYTVCPQIGLKDEYLQRYIDRGSHEKFVQLISDNWDEWISSFDYANQKNAFVLTRGMYLGSLIPRIFSYNGETNPVHPKDVYNFRGSLLYSEWRELVTLEYVLTWGYSDDIAKDEARYKELSTKKYSELPSHA